jgi:hypothetical protein
MIPPIYRYDYEVKARIQEIEEQAARFRRARLAFSPTINPRYNALLVSLGVWLVKRGEAIEARYSNPTIQPRSAH